LITHRLKNSFGCCCSLMRIVIRTAINDKPRFTNENKCETLAHAVPEPRDCIYIHGEQLARYIKLMKGKALRKIACKKISSLGFIEAVHQWQWKMLNHWRPLAHERNSFSNVNNIQSMIPEDQKYNYTMMKYGATVYSRNGWFWFC